VVKGDEVRAYKDETRARVETLENFKRVWAEEAHQRGVLECYQDRCEGIPLQQVGKDGEGHMVAKAPDYVPEDARMAFCVGYESMAAELYGSAWRRE
jgi:hypothetical protein